MRIPTLIALAGKSGPQRSDRIAAASGLERRFQILAPVRRSATAGAPIETAITIGLVWVGPLAAEEASGSVAIVSSGFGGDSVPGSLTQLSDQRAGRSGQRTPVRGPSPEPAAPAAWMSALTPWAGSASRAEGVDRTATDEPIEAERLELNRNGA